MKIAIDIDKTLVDCQSFLYEVINKTLSDQTGLRKMKYCVVTNFDSETRGIMNRISKK